MSNNLKKFVCPKFTRTIDPVLMARLFERHRDLLGDFDLQALRGDADGARGALEAFFAGPEERCPDGLVADLHRVADLGTAHGLRIMLDQSRRMGIALPPERSPDGDERRQDPKHVALRVFLDHPRVFEAAADMLALKARSKLAEFGGFDAGVEADLGVARREAFEAGAAKMFEADHCGRYCRVGWYEDGDSVNLVLTHGSIVRTTAILRDDEERLVSYRAAQNAVLSYSAATGRIRIGGGSSLRRSALAELFADRMLDRSGFFSGPDCAEPLHAGADRARGLRLRLQPRLRSGDPVRAHRRGAGRPTRHGPLHRGCPAGLDLTDARQPRRSVGPAGGDDAQPVLRQGLAAPADRHSGQTGHRRRPTRSGDGDHQAAGARGIRATPVRGTHPHPSPSQRADP